MPAQTASAEAVEVFRLRMQSSTDWLVRSLSATHMKDAAGAATVGQMLVALLRSAPAIEPEDLAATERLQRTAEFKRDLIRRAGDALSTDGVRKLLGHKSLQAVHKAVAARRLLAVDDGGRKLFPAFQFDGGSVTPAMAAVLAATPTTSPWALLQFMVEGDEGLGDERPMDMVTGGPETVNRLIRFARTLED